MKVDYFQKISKFFSENSRYSVLGGFFKARLDFPKDYPIKPPKMVDELFLFLYIINIFYIV